MTGPTLMEEPPFDSTKSSLENYLEVTNVTALGPNVFTNTRAHWHPPGERGIFGGSIIAQSLSAAYQTAPEGFHVHSSRTDFLFAASSDEPLLFYVEPIHDGRSYATRIVQARQRAVCVCTTTVSFARDGSGSASEGSIVKHAAKMPSEAELREASMPQADWQEIKLFETLPVQMTPLYLVNGGDPDLAKRKMWRWMRSRDNISEEGGHVAHIVGLGDFSDIYTLATVYRIHRLWREQFSPHDLPNLPDEVKQYFEAVHLREIGDTSNLENEIKLDPQRWIGRPEVGMIVTLNHSMYFHAPLETKADEWIFAETECPWTGAGRGLVTERFFSKRGTLLATCVQECIIRLKNKPAGSNEEAKL